MLIAVVSYFQEEARRSPIFNDCVGATIPVMGTTSPRMRRLTADQQSVSAAFAGHPYISVTPVGLGPVSQYQIGYRVPALQKINDELKVVGLTLVKIVLPPNYPRDKPYCTTSEPVFHPNFGNYICIADFWSPSQTLVDVIVEIGQLLQYQLYNTRSPLNALAARWVADNSSRIPIGELELLPVDPEIHIN